MRGRVDPWRRVEEAGSLSDYANWAAQDPSFADAGNQVVAQLTAEGADQTRILAAKSDLGKTIEDFSHLGLQIDDPVGAAKNYVLSAHSVSGAVSTIQGLAAAVQSGSPIEITQTFTGVMIGVAVAAGAFSAGVGAAIVAGAAGLVDILKSQGLFGSPSIGLQICQGVKANTDHPDIVVECMGGISYSAVIPPGHPDWRTFPAKTKIEDAPWFMPCGGGGCSEFNWKNVTWGNHLTANPAGPMRPIDYAFGAFGGIEGLLTSPYGPPGFSDGWCAAWKSNSEYALNGLKPQDEAMMTAHYVRMWNIAHEPTPVIPLSVAFNANKDYVARVRTFAQTSDLYGSDDIAVNAGPMRTSVRPLVQLHIGAIQPHVVRLTLGGARAAAPKTAVSGGSLLAVGALAMGAALLWKPSLLRKIGVRL